MDSDPLVSVILSTYNRAQVLRYAVESVVRSTYPNWELIVVGDACTDETAEVMASFDDPRIRFINLPHNFGEQSGPNNEGLRLAKGEYIAFLNHDDLYFPHHLSVCVHHLEHHPHDLVWTTFAVADPLPPEKLEQGQWQFSLWGVPLGEGYDGTAFVVGSSWVFRRSLIERIGPWHKAKECLVTPSQDWLFRAWKSGAQMHFLPRVTVLGIPGGARKDSYKHTHSFEHEFFAQQMQTNPAFHSIVTEAASIGSARLGHRRFYYDALKNLFRLIHPPLRILSGYLGIHPLGLYFLLRFGGRGEVINHARRFTGLSRLPEKSG